jgi:hypothetical protein
MKRTSLIVIATTLLIVIPTQSTAATKESVSKPKSAGRTGSVTPNTILSGTTAPSSAIGINGDFYIDIKNANIYGPKSNGKWLTPTSLRGLSGINGINGIDGKNGADAKNIISASSSTGPQGVQGEKGATGSSGAQGAQGPAGASGSGTGPTGAKGDTGLSGAAGTSGTNGTNGTNGSVGAQGSTGSQGSIGLTGFTGSTGSTGAKGDTGLSGATGTSGTNGTNGTNGSAGAQGSTGSQGSIGLTGSTGATGSVGPSNSYSGTVTFSSNLSGSAGTTKPSNNFGSFTGGKSYLVSIFVKTYNVTDNTVSYPINMTINSAGSGAVLNAYTYIATGSEYQNPGECLFTTLISELTIDGTGITGIFNIQVVPIIGAVGFNIAMIGKYFSTEVGQVG